MQRRPWPAQERPWFEVVTSMILNVDILYSWTTHAICLARSPTTPHAVPCVVFTQSQQWMQHRSLQSMLQHQPCCILVSCRPMGTYSRENVKNAKVCEYSSLPLHREDHHTLAGMQTPSLKQVKWKPLTGQCRRRFQDALGSRLKTTRPSANTCRSQTSSNLGMLDIVCFKDETHGGEQRGQPGRIRMTNSVTHGYYRSAEIGPDVRDSSRPWPPAR